MGYNDLANGAGARVAATAAPTGTRLDATDLVIDRIETIALRAPLGRRFSGSAYSMDNRCTIVVRITTVDGVVSETYSGDTDEEQALIVGIIHDELAPALLGRSARDPEGAWRAMEPSTNNILRDRGLALQAIAALDTAVWDVLGRAVGLPLYRLWGAVADSVPISIIGGYYHLDAEGTAQTVRRYVELGFGGLKFKVGGRTPAIDAERFRIAREAAGPDFTLMADANQGYTLAQAVEFARRVEGLALRWFEEPCRWTNDRRAMRDVRLMTGVPVCAGQSETTLHGIRDLAADGAIDVSNFDASWAGGPTIWRKAAGLCAAYGVALGHHEEPQVSSHLLASVPDHTFTECFDEERDPFFWHLTDMSTRVAGGRYRLPDAPGFGINLDWDYVEAQTVGSRVSTR
ncbi:MAG: mandelate racemase/muconate lactonizing enzyme family protein [Chloroflexota bacterium]